MESPIQAHVAHVVQNMAVGGKERVVVSLVNRIDHRRFRPSVYCLEDAGPLASEVQSNGFEVIALNKKPGLSWSLPLTLSRLFKKDHVELVHCHNFGGLVYGAIAGRLAGVRGVLYTAHGPEVPSGSKQAAFQRLPIVDKIVTVSDYVRESAIRRAGVNPSKVTTIRNGIDLERFAGPVETRERVRAELAVSPEQPLLGVVARLSPEKDHATVLEALALLRADFGGAVLAIVGEGDLMAKLKTKAGELGVGEMVRFLGNRSDVPALLHAMDVFVLASKEEGLGITLLEAMAAGLPVVATNVGGIPEVVVAGETGRLVPVHDPRGLAEAVKWMLSHPGDAKTMGLRGKTRVLDNFRVERMIDDYEAVYDDLLSTKKH